MKKSLLSLGSLCAMITAFASVAQAQSVDYGSLQDLFGEPVTTAATGTPQRASEVATNMTIITADEIRQSGSRNIPQILARVPGLDILQEGINTWDVGVRGYQQPYQPRLQVLIDGRQVFVDDYSRMNWDNLPVNVDDIRQIEVVKGASSALFGSNATGGVVNIITYSPIYDSNNVASATLGTQHEAEGDATATAKIGDVGGVKISGGGLALNDYDSYRPASEQKGYVENPYHRYVAENSVYKLNSNVELTSEANYSEKNGDEATFVYALQPVATTAYSAGGGINWQSPYGLIKNTNYINHYNDDIYVLGVIHNTSSLVDSQLEDQFKIGADHTFRALVEYKHNEFKTQNVPSAHYEYSDLLSDSYAAGGTWLWQINDKLSATNAIRFEHNVYEMEGTIENNTVIPQSAYNQAFNTVSANSGLVYKATDLDSFRLTYGRGIQNPSQIEFGTRSNLIVNPVVNSDIEGNPNIQPTVVENYELGYDRKISEIFSTARFSTYYELNRDLKARALTGLPVTPVGALAESINVGDSAGWGGEFELKGSHPSGFRWDGSYSYQTIRDADLVATTLNYAKSAPEHHLRLNLGYTTGPWEFDTFGQYVTSTDMLGTTKTPTYTAGYGSLSGRIGYKIDDHFTVAASMFNINQQNLVESPYPAIQRQAMLTLTGKF